MTPPDLLTFVGACVGSLVCGCVLAGILHAAAARWPALHAHRSIWLLAQVAIAAVFALAWVPLARSPIVTLPALAPARVETVLAALPASGDDALPAPLHSETGLAGMAARGILAIYVGGLAWQLAAALRARRRWRRTLAAHTRAVDAADLAAWPALSHAQRARIAAAALTVRVTELPLSPMLAGVLRPCLLLPAHLAALDAGQQRLIVEHELTHLRRADPAWLLASALLDAAFWFNWPLRRMGARVREAVELGCDDAVLARRCAAERLSYAAALVAQLRLQLQWQGPGCATAFGAVGLKARVQRMQAARPARLSARGRALCAASVLGCAAGGAWVQPAFSSNGPALAAPVTATAPAPQGWRYPLDEVRVTTLYGVRVPSVPQGIHGVDFAARRGTPVLAVAAGTVNEAAANPVWGRYVRVDHGGGVSSLLVHLDSVDVTAGQHVTGGQRLGAAGASGRASGPHVHLEYWRDGHRLDPALMLADLPFHATAAALARRRAQGNPIPTDE